MSEGVVGERNQRTHTLKYIVTEAKRRETSARVTWVRSDIQENHMKLTSFIAIVATAGLLAAGSVSASDDAHDSHHPSPVTPKSAEPAPQSEMGGMGMGMGKMGPDHVKKMEDMHGAKMGGTAPNGDTGPSSQAYVAANMKMHQAMAITFTGDADVDFAKGMIAHHQGAIDMAKVELQYGKDEKTRKLAEEIMKAQEAEIAMMTDWLKSKGQK